MLDEAEQLFARGGYQGVTTRQITTAAEQGNTSAVSYHFGSRQGLLLAVLARRGGPIDEERGRLRSALGASPTLAELVSCLVMPYAAVLHGGAGRSYLQIVAQLRGRFAAWRVESDAATTANLAAIVDEIEASLTASPAVRRERVAGLIMLLTGTVAERARRIDAGLDNDLTHQEFTANLVAMCAAAVAA
ncbi:TetR/AcrR family transcriptional regulator [soil metagenome]